VAALERRTKDALAYRNGRHGTKVALVAPSLDHLLGAQADAERLGLPAALVVDSGHILPPRFDGSPVVTALGIGPARRSEVRRITNRFALVP
jgi:peptidyl-tRNA hydrolase